MKTIDGDTLAAQLVAGGTPHPLEGQLQRNHAERAAMDGGPFFRQTRIAWGVRQTFETLGDDCSETFLDERKAEAALATLQCVVAAMVADMAVTWDGPEWTGYPREHDAWGHALDMVGAEFDDSGNQISGPEKWGAEVGEYIASEACKMEQVEVTA
jgi:hypothetical protein